MDKKNIDEALKRMENGELKLYALEKSLGIDSNTATMIRRVYLEKKFGCSLSAVGSGILDFNDAVDRNIENPVGAVHVPLGYAGEIKVNGMHASRSYPILLATTEGKLVAGISRGISASNEAGGINAAVIRDGMTRDVLIRTGNVKEAAAFSAFVSSAAGQEILRKAFSRSTRHGRFIECRPYPSGRDVHLRFRATTGAAMGMNMVTIASKMASDAIVIEFGKSKGIEAGIVSESGNMCSDKKPALINFIEGRGVSVIVDMFIPAALLEKRFGLKPEAVADLNKSKNLSGSALAGSHGFNGHVANMLASLYLALGQDMAQVVEGAQALTDAAVVRGGLYISCYLPSIEIGTYGGGTKRETQMEVLKMMGLYGDNDPEGTSRLQLAEVIAAVCLAGELNLLCAEAAKDLSSSHGRIKR